VITRAENEPIESSQKEPVRSEVQVETVSDPWEQLPVSADVEMGDDGKPIEQDSEYSEAVAYATLEALQEVNQHFFIQNTQVFKDNMLAGCDDDEEEEEEDYSEDDE
jgi:hypothetical protein